MLVPALPEEVGRRLWVARLLVAGVAALGGVITIALWLVVSRVVDTRVASEFAETAEQQAGLIQRRFADSLLPVSSLAVFHETHDAGDAAVFRLVAEAANRLGVPAARLGWAPLVRHDDRAAHEAGAWAEGLAGYGIVTFAEDGRFRPAPDKDEYLPLRFELLGPGFPSALGFDVLSTPDRRGIVEQARRLRQPIATIPSIRQSLLRQTGFVVIYWPIFAAGPAASPAPDGLRGVVTALIKLSDLLAYVTAGLPPVEGRLVLLATLRPGGATEAVGHIGPDGTMVPGAPAHPSAQAVRRSFASLGVTWHVDLEPDPAAWDARRGWTARYVVFCSIAATLALALVVYALLRKISLEQDLRTLSERVLEQESARAREVEALNAQLQVQERLARNAAMVRTRLLASASHDVRQPLQAMLVHAGTIELAARDEATRRAVSGVRSAVAALRSMFGVFLDLHRLDGAKVQVQRGPVDLGRLLRRLCDEFAPEADRKGIVLRLREPCPTAWTDPALLEVVLRNLIGNAVKFTRAGGVQVAVRRRRRLEIQVWDSGPGIAPDAQGRVFEEFAQLSDDRSGAGLGLSIAQRMAALLEGDVRVRSRPGRGSCFTVALPREDDLLAELAAVREAGAA